MDVYTRIARIPRCEQEQLRGLSKGKLCLAERYFCARLAVCSAVAVMAAVASSTPRRFTKREGVVSLMAPRIADVY